MAKMIRSIGFFVVALFVGAAPAMAQGVYVNASAGVSVLRFGGVEDGGITGLSRNGEPGSWSMRVGAPLGSRWGIELEFVRTLESKEETTIDLLRGIPAGLPGGFTVSGLYSVNPSAIQWTSAGDVTVISSSLSSPFDVRYRAREQQSSLVPTVWFRTDVSRRIAMVFLGGVAFNRTARETEFSLPTLPIFSPVAPIRSTLAPSSTKSTQYGTGAAVGIEARIGLTDHVQLIPGVRMQGLGGGWSLRPAVGMGWQF